MGCKGKDKTSSDAHRKSCHSKVRSKDKQPPTECQCAQVFDTSFPFKDLPPPAPPDGRNDLWDLQFCRWWGWNWVRKRDSLVGAEPKCGTPKRPCLTAKYREEIKEQENCVKPTCPTARKTCFSGKDPETRPCNPSVLTPKEQFKAMCKCLLGKKKTPCEIGKLYNTPSTSMVAFQKQDRVCYGVGDRTFKQPCKDPEKCGRKAKRETIKEGIKAKPCPLLKPPEESTTPCSEQSATDSVICESLYSHKQESSTEESVEYLTVRLQQITSNMTCLCRKQSPLKTQQQPVKDEPENTPLVCRDSKETQTQQAEQSEQKTCTAFESAACPEKLIKLKGKKHKTICIMVCCCGTCKQNGEAPRISDQSEQSYQKPAQASTKEPKECVCQPCPKLCWKDQSAATEEPQRDCNKCSTFAIDKFTTFPISVPPLSAKKLSKFGTPSKNYAWMQTTNSVMTTTSLNNIGRYSSSYKDVYDWLDPEVDKSNTSQPFNLHNFIDIAEDLSYMKKIDSPHKSTAEDRILLDAVCDAILQEHEGTANHFFDELQFSTNNQQNKDYTDLGVLCNFNLDNHSKADVCTELSQAVINTEDIGIQLSKASNIHNILDSSLPNIDTEDVGVQWFRRPDLQSILEQSDAKTLDNMMSSIMDNIFSESNHSINKVSTNLLCSTHTRDLENHVKSFKEYASNSEKPKNPFEFIGKSSTFTRTGLLPYQTSPTFRKTIKRAAGPEKENSKCKKKLKQDEEKCPKTALTEEHDNKIGHIFSKIDDIVHKSKAKTAEIQKVLHSVSYSGLRQNIEPNSTEPIMTDNSKRNYPMSSDNFKGTIYEPLKPKFDYNSIKGSYMYNTHDGFKNYYGQSSGLLEDQGCSKTPAHNHNETQQAVTSNLNSKISKLSVNSFLVCDEKSKVDLPNSTMKVGKRLIKKKNGSKTSLIPIRK